MGHDLYGFLDLFQINYLSSTDERMHDINVETIWGGKAHGLAAFGVALALGSRLALSRRFYFQNSSSSFHGPAPQYMFGRLGTGLAQSH